ncbi:hypothetical protein D3C81_1681200 [compost metagenome]
MREDPFLHADDEHDRELQALGTVHRHQHDRIVVWLLGIAVVVHAIDIRDQRQIRQEGDQRLIFIIVLEFHRDGQELVDILQPRAGFQRVLVLQLQPVLGHLQQLLG